MDRRAHHALERWGLSPKETETLAYIDRVRRLRDRLNRDRDLSLRARGVDKALFVLSLPRFSGRVFLGLFSYASSMPISAEGGACAQSPGGSSGTWPQSRRLMHS